MFQLAGGLVLADLIGSIIFIAFLVCFFIGLSVLEKKKSADYLRATRGEERKSSDAKLFAKTAVGAIISIAKWGIGLLAFGILARIAIDAFAPAFDSLPPVVQTLIYISPIALAIIYLLIKYFVLNAKNVPWKQIGICSIFVVLIFAGVIIWAKISG